MLFRSAIKAFQVATFRRCSRFHLAERRAVILRQLDKDHGGILQAVVGVVNLGPTLNPCCLQCCRREHLVLPSAQVPAADTPRNKRSSIARVGKSSLSRPLVGSATANRVSPTKQAALLRYTRKVPLHPSHATAVARAWKLSRYLSVRFVEQPIIQ